MFDGSEVRTIPPSQLATKNMHIGHQELSNYMCYYPIGLLEVTR